MLVESQREAKPPGIIMGSFIETKSPCIIMGSLIGGKAPGYEFGVLKRGEAPLPTLPPPLSKGGGQRGRVTL
jgi:hypothetical protein